MLRDHQDCYLHLALRERRTLVEKRADLLHAARDRRAVNPNLVRAENASATGGELVEDFCLLGAELLLGNFENAVHAAGGLCWQLVGGNNETYCTSASKPSAAEYPSLFPPTPFQRSVAEEPLWKNRLGGRGRPRFSRSVLPSYSRRNRPRRCSSGTTLSTKSSSPPGR